VILFPLFCLHFERHTPSLDLLLIALLPVYRLLPLCLVAALYCIMTYSTIDECTYCSIACLIGVRSIYNMIQKAT
jgi:hypothetical protein